MAECQRYLALPSPFEVHIALAACAVHRLWSKNNFGASKSREERGRREGEEGKGREEGKGKKKAKGKEGKGKQ